jgi:HD-GYP domain-containing protein (c-di-GMP phosphodiesterase class II)
VAPEDQADVLQVVADFADLKSPFLVGHSSGVARLAEDAAAKVPLPASDVAEVGHAALVHDLGRVGVTTRIWGKAGPLDAGEWEAVRLHPYHTERLLARAPYLQRLSSIAGMHHERMDGSGYVRGVVSERQSPAARLLAAADVYHAMIEPRPHRPPKTHDQARAELEREVRDGKLDRPSVDAILEAAGHPATRRKRYTADLTAREIEVLRLVARGRSTKGIAQLLVISPKTADNHLRSIYGKVGASTRAAATVFAMQHGLVEPTTEPGER